MGNFLALELHDTDYRIWSKWDDQLRIDRKGDCRTEGRREGQGIFTGKLREVTAGRGTLGVSWPLHCTRQTRKELERRWTRN